MRNKIYQMVHLYDSNFVSIIYKYFMIVVIAVSLLPLMSKQDMGYVTYLEWFCLLIFVIDYILRWSTADYKFGSDKWLSFVRYPFRLISIIDMLSIFALVSSVAGWFVGLKIAKVLTVFRIVRIFRYSKSVRTILEILKKSKKPLAAVGGLAIGYIFISAIVIFNVEPESFQSFFDAIYWSTITLTTVGFGDYTPVTVAGKAVAIITSLLGIAVFALPTGIITAGYLAELDHKKNR